MGLVLEGVTHRYGALEAVAGFSLAVEPGEVVCLVGPSGCGKSTVLRLAAGLEPLQTGRISIDGRVVAGEGRTVPPEDRHIGLVFQDFALFPHLSVLDNVAFGMREGAVSARRARARALLDRLGMADFATAYPHSLSGGEQQRVALARALAAGPQLMLLDEPFSGLDVRLRDSVRDDTLALLKEAGTPVLLVTHDPEEAMRMADRIAVMRRGRLVQVGPPDLIYDQPEDFFVADFFGNINALEGVVEGNSVTTALGPLALNRGRPNGHLTVAVRNEGIRIWTASANARGVPARVENARLLGPFAIVTLALYSGPSVNAHVPAAAMPEPGQKVHVDFDPAQAFVFPR